MHVTHDLLRPGIVEFRGYQANLARIAGRHDTLVVLPTGLGKTVVAVLALADALQQGAKRILFLAPTRPLVDQHGKGLASSFAPPWSDRIHVLTGTMAPARRAEAYREPGIVVATPQVVQNDILAGSLDVRAIDWVVFDEAHRAVGDYPYAFIGGEFQRKAPRARRLGLTASPGHDVRRLEEVRGHLGLEHVEIRTPADADVTPYIQKTDVEWETLPLPPTMARVSRKLNEALQERVRQMKALGFLKEAGSRPGRRDLLELGRAVAAQLGSQPNPDSRLFTALSLQAQAMKIHHAVEQVETQGARAFTQYVEGVREEASSGKPSKATQSFLHDPRVNEAYHIARLDDSENPKVGRTGVLVQEELDRVPGGRIIVFAQYRATCETVAAHLSRLPGVKPVVFVGQQKRGASGGMTQKVQHETLERFRRGEVNVLIATSVAEEGLDIPSTDLVVFFEPIPSEIRVIQRRGRTGRQSAGRVVVLMTKGTMDEASHWASRRKEEQMVKQLQELRMAVGSRPRGIPAPPEPGPAKQSTLHEDEATDDEDEPDDRASESGEAAQGMALRSAALSASEKSPVLAITSATMPAATMTSEPASLGEGPRILFDHREQGGGVVRALHEFGARLESRQLEVADFILSDRVAVERKTTRDFVESLLDGRLFDQLKAMKAYPKPLLVLEGGSLHGHRNVSPEAILGALASVAIDYGIPVFQTRDGPETARLLLAAAKREQDQGGRKMAVRPGKGPMRDSERLVFILSGFPGLSDVLAQRLLERFGSLDGVFRATPGQLAEVDGIGSQKAADLRRLLALEWAIGPAVRTETV